VLFWGILGALIMRGAMIGLGAKLIAEFHWVLYVFAVFLVVTGVKMLFMKSGETDLGKNFMVRFVRKWFPVSERYHGEHFMVRAGTAASHEAAVPGAKELPDAVVDGAKAGTLILTPLALALLMVETTDVIFAVDSIPAIFAITGDPFLVFTSNVFAILGLRSLYFALAGMVQKFRYLKIALAAVLMIVGFKMMLATWLKLVLGEHFNLILLMVIAVVLACGVIGSIVADRRDTANGAKT
jgi:tellurite resistance protein TerC